MKELQFDNNFWTTSFKKLLASTENDKKLRLVNKILRKALGEEGKKLLDKIDPVYSSPIKTKNDEYKKNSCHNHKLNNYNTANTHIYETITVKSPQPCVGTKNSENESNKTNIDNAFRTPIKVRTPISQQLYIPMYYEKNASLEYINSTLIKHEGEYQNINHNNQGDTNVFEENEVLGTVKSKIALYEDLARRSMQNINLNNQINSVDKLNIINTCKSKQRPEYFLDESGKILSPISKPQSRPGANIEKKFVINMFNNTRTYTQENKTNHNESGVLRIGDKFYRKDNIVNNETTINTTRTDKFLKKRNRITRSSILEAFDHLEHFDASEILPELDAMATELETIDSSTYIFDTNRSDYANEDEPIYAYPNKISKQEKCSLYDDFFKLKEEADKQCKIMKQASKAIDLIKENEYNLIETQIEAEKILLTAGYKYERLLEEIRHSHYEDPMTYDKVGSMVIGGIQAELEERRDVECFICIVSSENDVLCSKVVEVGPKAQNVSFPEEFVFDNLHSSFQIKIDIFSMKLNRRKCSYKINKKVSNLCRNSRKLFYKDLHTYSLVESEVPISSFTLNGTITIALDDLIIPNNFRVNLTKPSSLTGYVQVNSRLASININKRKQGFLTIGMKTDYGVIWNRRWCVLQGSSLKYWNYPNDEVSKQPIGELNLNHCTKEVEKARRSVCARTKTLLMETNNYVCFFNCDTIAELHDWRNILNKVYDILSSWKMLEHQQGTDL